MLNYIFNDRNDIDKSKIFLHGRSLGGAVVNYVMTNSDYPVAGIILENTFTSISDLIDIMFPLLAFMKKIIQRNFWPSIDRINKIKKPILFIMGIFIAFILNFFHFSDEGRNSPTRTYD